MDMWRKQGGRCALSGIPMTWAKGDSNGWSQPFSLSLDRIDQTRSYEPGNVRLVCHCINCFRGRMSDDTLFDVLKKFFHHQFGVLI